MAEYGYINEGGYLHSRIIEDCKEQYFDGKQQRERIVSEDEQAQKLIAFGWKPVEEIDPTKLVAEEGFIVRLIPYDAGDCIRFHYETVKDVQLLKRKMEELKQSLTDSDYKIIKCYEATIAGEPLPYDFNALRTERQEARNQINDLEIEICGI